MFQIGDIRTACNAFFEAMRDGYAFDASGAQVEPSTGAKLVAVTTSDGLVVHDRWWNGRDKYSCGVTTIFLEDKPVWSMSYRGMYPKSVVPVLKRALQVNYLSNTFLGGRGPREFVFDGFTYKNEVNSYGNFDEFHGEETIRKGPTVLGWHRYQGGLLAERNRS